MIAVQPPLCAGVHSACRREEMGAIWIFVLRRLRLRQGQMQGFVGLKVGGGALNLQIWDKELFFQYYRFSACVDANYDIKESVKDIQQTVQ